MGYVFECIIYIYLCINMICIFASYMFIFTYLNISIYSIYCTNIGSYGVATWSTIEPTRLNKQDGVRDLSPSPQK